MKGRYAERRVRKMLEPYGVVMKTNINSPLPDIIFFQSGVIYLIEVKSGRAKLKKEQLEKYLEWKKGLEKEGFQVEVLVVHTGKREVYSLTGKFPKGLEKFRNKILHTHH